MSHRLAGFCILASSLLIVPAANGQITTKTLSSTTLTVAPLATTSFTPYSMGSTLVGKALGLSLMTVQLSYASTAPTQTCDTGTLQVADGKLDLTLQVPQGVQLNLARITVNALR